MPLHELLKYLGDVGRQLPELSEDEWKIIFEFVELFTDTEETHKSSTFEYVYDWKKLHEIITLLGKINNEGDTSE